MARLSQQVDAIRRGEVPSETVRGAREIERLGTALTTMARQRAAFDEQRRVMLMGVSHDLRSPLTRIRVAADLLERAGAAARPDRAQRRTRRRDHRKLPVVRANRRRKRRRQRRLQRGGERALPGWRDCLPLRCASRRRQRARKRDDAAAAAGNLLDNAARHGAPPIVLSLADRSQRPPGGSNRRGSRAGHRRSEAHAAAVRARRREPGAGRRRTRSGDRRAHRRKACGNAGDRRRARAVVRGSPCGFRYPPWVRAQRNRSSADCVPTERITPAVVRHRT